MNERSGLWRSVYVGLCWFFALFYLGVDVGCLISTKATLAGFNWAANLLGMSGAMGDPSHTIANAFMFAYFVVLMVSCLQCIRNPESSAPLVAVCSGKATSGSVFLYMSLTVSPAYGFIFILDVLNIVGMVLPYRMMMRQASTSAVGAGARAAAAG